MVLLIQAMKEPKAAPNRLLLGKREECRASYMLGKCEPVPTHVRACVWAPACHSMSQHTSGGQWAAWGDNSLLPPCGFWYPALVIRFYPLSHSAGGSQLSFYFEFWDRVSVSRPGWTWTHFIAQVNPWTFAHVSASWAVSWSIRPCPGINVSQRTLLRLELTVTHVFVLILFTKRHRSLPLTPFWASLKSPSFKKFSVNFH